MSPRVLLACLLAAALFAAGCPKPAPVLPRHVVLLVIDTQRADRLGCYGHGRALTPAIDALAAESVLFERCASQASWTSPSMVSLMTGCYVAEELLGIPKDKETLAECFRQAGWTTAGFVCNNILNAENGFPRGFATFEGELVPYGPNTPILGWLRAHKDERTFTWIHLNEVHDEAYAYRAQPESEWRKFRDVRAGFSAGRMQYYGDLTTRLKLVEGERSLERMQEEDGGYDDDVRCEDKRIGEILAELQRLGMWNETLLVLGADHGEGLFTREQFFNGTRKRAADQGEPPTLFNTLQMTHGAQVNTELVHVPLIVKAPGIPAARVAPWVENVDIAPTLLELCGIPSREQHQGASLVGLLVEPDGDALVEAVFTHSRYNDSVIGQDSLQLILASAQGNCDFNLPQAQLYDLKTDPEARRDLAGRQPARERALSALADRRLKQGLGGNQGPLSPAMLKILTGMGYVGGTVEGLAERFRPKSTPELLALIPSLAGDCLSRREIAKLLGERSLARDELAGIREWRKAEGSPAVRVLLDRILAGK